MNSKFSLLFEPYTLNNQVEIKNRLVVAPMTHFGSNPDGTLGEAERAFIGNRAGDMGMFITAATLVADNGKAFFGQPAAIRSEEHLASLKETAQIIQTQGAKAILQIHHGGKLAVENLINGLDKVSASADEATGTRALSVKEIHALIDAYAYAADLAIQAGFDGVEIHGANNYLIQQFYSGHSNRRTDEWGGSRENRMRFPLAIVEKVLAVKAKYQREDFIVGYRFSPEEPEELGLTMADTLALVDALTAQPLQYLHVSLHEFYKKARRGADISLSRMQLIHDRINGKLPLIGVGCLFTAEQILEAYQTGWAEFIGLGKTVMMNPAVATLIRLGRETEIVTELDLKKADQYSIHGPLWDLCQRNSPWLTKVKNTDWKPLDL